MYNQIEFSTDVPCLVLSEGRSMLPNDAQARGDLWIAVVTDTHFIVSIYYTPQQTRESYTDTLY